jgi:uncharacterized membrane protein YozB (DUF420 family)
MFLAAQEVESASVLPFVNACFNATAATLLVCGLVAIKRGARVAHERFMLGALAASTLFLAGYLWYHFGVQADVGPTRFHASGAARTAYFVLLVTHVLGAIVNLPMVLRTFWLAHREDWTRHRWWAKRSFPLWLYVSVTGVAVYVVLYHFNPVPPS